MRDHDEDGPKKPQPVSSPKKAANALEAAEARPWRLTRKDDPHDHRRHRV
jgi:hypothetical protein